MRILIALLCLVAPCAADAMGQVATVRGSVLDDAGGVLPGATVGLAFENGNPRETTTDGSGRFAFAGVGPGEYRLRVTLTGFQAADVKLSVKSSDMAPVIVRLRAGFGEEVVVTGDPTGGVLAPTQNADAIEFDPEALRQLPVDMQNLQALVQNFTAAGPAGGVSFVVDGVETNAADVPAAAIHRLWINRNPYAIEYQSPGKARAEIETHTGSRRYFHGAGALFARNSALDSRNALAATVPDLERLLSEGAFGGPLLKKGWSFFTSGQRLASDDDAVVSAHTASGPFATNVATSQRRATLLGRVDFRPRKTHTLTLRYDVFDDIEKARGVGGLRLPDQAYDTAERRHRLQTSDRQVWSSRIVNEARGTATFSDRRDGASAAGPAIVVAGSFTGGPSQVHTGERAASALAEDIATFTSGRHTVRVGAKAKMEWTDVLDASNFGGTFTFASLSEFSRGRPIELAVRRGNPSATYSDLDITAFSEIDFRPTDTVGIVAGLRYDRESRIDDIDNLSPRASVAFAPAKRKIVLRGGAGMFYGSLPDSAVARTQLFGLNGIQEATVTAPPYPASVSTVDFHPRQLTTWQLDPNLRTPAMTQATASVERLLWRRTSIAVEYLLMRTSGALRTRDVNAPAAATGLRLDQSRLNVNQIEATGISRTRSLTTTFRGRIGGFKGSMQYVWSRSMDDTAGVFDLPADNHDLAAELGRADYDRRHRFNVAGTYEWAHDRMRLSTLLTMASGAPFDITTGSDDNHDLTIEDRPAGVTRNIGLGPTLVQADVRFTTVLRAPRPPSADPESRKRDFIDNLELNLDIFNLLNAVNANSIVGVISSPLFGRPSSVRSARSMQLSLRYRF